MCDDSSDKVLNASHDATMAHTATGERTVILEYGPYMNWGRWNHNPYRIQPLVDALIDAGIKVQLSHCKEESTFQDHGWIKICTDAGKSKTSTVISDVPLFQHNRNYHRRAEMIPGLVDETIQHFKAQGKLVEITKVESKEEAIAG